MLFSTLVKAVLGASVFVGASPSPLILPIGGGSKLPTYPPGIGNATFDGKTKCTFPLPEAGFTPSKYVGTPAKPAVWYQLAASFQFFEVGCSCVYAKYGAYSNGSISVTNFCLKGNSPSSISGVAVPRPNYGGAGAYTVMFGQPSGSCGAEAPNYIVSKYYTDSKGKYTAAVVGSDNFDSWFLLSKQRIVDATTIDGYLKDIATLGYDLSKSYSITKQNSTCPSP
ncbi:hypothetical protein OC846_005856 [Tilletia horrida]|uniref:Lipocalin/cytosolic fatty-acid binding domain-containing protein n=1 Tax=Tilletia horrida TaxID=155126 RepID=A0AAN6GJY6_9BASI|nr:hypothetical protein OC845_005684 [Tilletia horrida]KAK0544947.1 hypothetical protein OC846_005856 [Tilletia horrida]